MSDRPTIRLEPTADEYEAIARAFVDSMAHDVSEATGPDGPRRASALRILRELIGLAGYLATLPDGPERIARLQSFTEGA